MDIITLIANVALALSFVIGLIFGIAQVNTANRDRRERLTIETLRNFQTREFAELILFINSHNMPSNSKEMNALPPGSRYLSFSLDSRWNHSACSLPSD